MKTPLAIITGFIATILMVGTLVNPAHATRVITPERAKVSYSKDHRLITGRATIYDGYLVKLAVQVQVKGKWKNVKVTTAAKKSGNAPTTYTVRHRGKPGKRYRVSVVQGQTWKTPLAYRDPAVNDLFLYSYEPQYWTNRVSTKSFRLR